MKFENPAQFGRIDPKDWKQFPKHYTGSIWPDVLPRSPKDYGSNDFHGRTHPEIIAVALQRYTKPGDLVWDPFAGSGTTIDVCKEFDCECVAYDIISTRDDIEEVNSQRYIPNDPVDLVICHPPYMDIVEYDAPGTLATSDLGEYLRGMENVFCNIEDALKDWHVLVLIVGTVYKDGEVILLDNELLNSLMYRNWPCKPTTMYFTPGNAPMDYHWRLLGRVVRGFGETKGGATSGKKNENLWKYRRLKSGIWELGQDVVLFLQKIPISD